jgi:lipoprotein-anchoring transpeptidase ErfK/SrfK
MKGNNCLSWVMSASSPYTQTFQIFLTDRMPSPLQIIVDVPAQRLDLLTNEGETITSYPVSTSRFGLGNESGSFRTPIGNFRIGEKIGEGEPAWMIFQGRVPTGNLALPGGEEDLILTRILWLGGVDPENANTHERYIYFHGTNQESLIGTPASHGCIRLRNLDMIDLYNRVESGTTVKIRS